VNAVLKLELFVGLLVSFTLLGILIWSIKKGGFDDSKRMMDGVFFDSEDDLRDAVNRENKQKALRTKKQEELEKKAKKQE
jgi:cbb3-type cytochrome oxidase maturation protein